MFLKKKYLMVLALAGIVSLGVAALPADNGPYKNLRVLPKNISTKDLSRIMIDDFEDGLGVTCGFCHAEEKNSHKLDYASDEKPEKEIARIMMKMTKGINKKFFHIKRALIGDPILAVTCVTCHKGQARPGEAE